MFLSDAVIPSCEHQSIGAQTRLTRDVARGGATGRPPRPWGFQEAPGWNQGPGEPKAHVGQNHVGGERNSQESQNSSQDNKGPLTSLTARVLFTSWGLL